MFSSSLFSTNQTTIEFDLSFFFDTSWVAHLVGLLCILCMTWTVTNLLNCLFGWFIVYPLWPEFNLTSWVACLVGLLCIPCMTRVQPNFSNCLCGWFIVYPLYDLSVTNFSVWCTGTEKVMCLPEWLCSPQGLCCRANLPSLNWRPAEAKSTCRILTKILIECPLIWKKTEL